MKQRHSRATGKAITELVFMHDVTVYGALQEVVSVPETGVYVTESADSAHNYFLS